MDGKSLNVEMRNTKCFIFYYRNITRPRAMQSFHSRSVFDMFLVSWKYPFILQFIFSFLVIESTKDITDRSH
jgi:hypothetical protein